MAIKFDLRSVAVPLLAVSAGTANADPNRPSEFSVWTGPYLGGFAGYSEIRTSATRLTFPGRANDIIKNSGGFFGGQAGYNIQANQFVFGLEGDIGFLTAPSETIRLKDTYAVDYDWFSTVRGRTGLAFDNLLVFSTAGVAFTKLETSRRGNSTVIAGFVAGGGIEYMFRPGWSLKVEYLRTDFGAIRGSGNLPRDTTYSPVSKVVKGGVNFHF